MALYPGFKTRGEGAFSCVPSLALPDGEKRHSFLKSSASAQTAQGRTAQPLAVRHRHTQLAAWEVAAHNELGKKAC